MWMKIAGLEFLLQVQGCLLPSHSFLSYVTTKSHSISPEYETRGFHFEWSIGRKAKSVSHAPYF